MEQKFIEVIICKPEHAERQAHMERMEKIRRRTFGVLAAASGLMTYGVVGSVETDRLALGAGALLMVAGMAATVLFTWLAGGFEHEK